MQGLLGVCEDSLLLWYYFSVEDHCQSCMQCTKMKRCGLRLGSQRQHSRRSTNEQGAEGGVLRQQRMQGLSRQDGGNEDM